MTGDPWAERLIAGNVHSAITLVEDANGQACLSSTAGIARVGGASVQMDSVFHIASVAKTFTATLVLQSHERGELDIDAPLKAHDVFDPGILARLHDPAEAGRITLRHLLSHMSGLRDAVVDSVTEIGTAGPGSLIGYILREGGDPSQFWSPWDPERPYDIGAGVLNYFINSGMSAAPLFAPGEGFHYSDTGYVLLGLTLERVTGKPLASLYRERIFEPLGMTSAYLAYRDDPPGVDRFRNPECEVWMGDTPALAAGFSLSFDWAGGGIVCNAGDLATFLRALLAGKLFSAPETLQRMTAWQAPPGLEAPRTGVGLGLFQTRSHGRELVGHAGHWGVRMHQEAGSGRIVTGTINQSHGPANWHHEALDHARPEARA